MTRTPFPISPVAPRPFSRRSAVRTGLGLSAGLALAAGGWSHRSATARQLGAADASGTFSYTSFEGEEEMVKWQAYIDEYLGATYPNVETQSDYGAPWANYWTKLQTSIAGGAPPTMAWMHDTRAKPFASLDLLLPLDDYIAALAPEGWPDRFYASQVEAFSYDGKVYGIPYDWATGGMYLNLDLYAKAGVTPPTEATTFDELLEGALAIKAASDDPDTTYGFNLPTSASGSDWIVRSFGGQGFSGQPVTATWDSPNTIAAYQFVYDAVFTHKVMMNPLEIEQAGLQPEFVFISGQIGASYALNDSAFRMNDAVAGAFDWTVAPTPRGAGGRTQFVGGSAFSIPKGSNLPEIAYEVARFAATAPEHLSNTALVGSMFVSRSDLWQDSIPGADSGVDPEAYKHAFYDLPLQDGQVPLYHPRYQEWETSIFIRITDQLWAGEETDVTAAMQRLQSETVALLEGP